MDDIIYTTIDEQIEKLKQQHLHIDNEETARIALKQFGYSNLIKSYREPYTIIADGKKVYRSGVTFNQIYSLYILDKELRNAVMAAMLDLEEHMKENAADVIASAFGTHPDNYLKFSNYANKRKRKRQFSLTGILKTLNDTLATDKNPIHHYQEVHGIVPPWILFKSIYFSTLSNYIDQFKNVQKDELVKKIYDLSVLKLSEESSRLLLMDTLFICQEYRNIAAHGGRTYNYECTRQLRIEEIWGTDTDIEFTGFSQLLFLLSLLEYDSPYSHLHIVLNRELNRHCKAYPQDVTYLAQILNVDIEQREVAWITDNSKKFHANPYCSGITNARQIDKTDIIKRGYIPCKRCFKK